MYVPFLDFPSFQSCLSPNHGHHHRVTAQELLGSQSHSLFQVFEPVSPFFLEYYQEQHLEEEDKEPKIALMSTRPVMRLKPRRPLHETDALTSRVRTQPSRAVKQTGQPRSADQDDSDIEIVAEEKAEDTWFNPVGTLWKDMKTKELGVDVVVKDQDKECVPRRIPMDRKPRKTAKIKGDGNCFFRALSYALSGSDRYYIYLRDLVCEFMIEFSHHFKPLTMLEPGEYIQHSEMDQDGTWATEVEILAAATLLDTPLVIFSQNGPEQQWLVYKPLKQLSRGCQLEPSQSRKAVYLSNLCSHFEPVLKV